MALEDAGPVAESSPGPLRGPGIWVSSYTGMGYIEGRRWREAVPVHVCGVSLSSCFPVEGGHRGCGKSCPGDVVDPGKSDFAVQSDLRRGYAARFLHGDVLEPVVATRQVHHNPERVTGSLQEIL